MAFRRHSEFQISASFYDVITNDTVGKGKRNEKVWQVVRGCAGEGATEFQRVFRSPPRELIIPGSGSRCPHYHYFPRNSQLYGYSANQSSNENCNPFFFSFSFSFLSSTRKKEEISIVSNDKVTNSSLYLHLCDSIFFYNVRAFQVDWMN